MYRKFPLELIVWTGALMSLALSDPADHQYTLCPFANLGFSWCPGCGLGRSITAILHLDLPGSIRSHWFGIPAFLILVNRVCQLSQKFRLNLEP
jgi:hypothetical protein